MKKTIALLISSFALLIISACGNTTDSSTLTDVTPEAELVITATDFQFDQAEYRVKKDVPLQITFVNEQGNHGILIPGLSVQLSGKKTTAVVIPTKVGEYEVSCSIMCGAGHSKMVSTIIVEE